MTEPGRLEEEKTFHDQRFGGDDSERKNARKYYSADKHLKARYAQIVSELCEDKDLLEYGCGMGRESKRWLKRGARVTGIDISPEGIKKAKEYIEGSEYQADYFVMDAEKTEFDESSFDLIVGNGIIHHLDLTKSYQEMSRILKKNGHIVFSEPLGHNPLVGLYRWLTPEMRTKDEHPLKAEDIRALEDYFHNVEFECFALFTLAAVPFRNTSIFNWLYDFLGKVDNTFFRLPFVKKYAWMAIIHAYNPRK